MQTLNPLACALFLIASFVIAGVAQTAWFATEWSRKMAFPLDGGVTLRGRPLFGENKTLRGFVVMVPATAIAFVAVALGVASGSPGDAGLWHLTPLGYAALGAWAGFGFMPLQSPPTNPRPSRRSPATPVAARPVTRSSTPRTT